MMRPRRRAVAPPFPIHFPPPQEASRAPDEDGAEFRQPTDGLADDERDAHDRLLRTLGIQVTAEPAAEPAAWWRRLSWRPQGQQTPPDDAHDGDETDNDPPVLTNPPTTHPRAADEAAAGEVDAVEPASTRDDATRAAVGEGGRQAAARAWAHAKQMRSLTSLAARRRMALQYLPAAAVVWFFDLDDVVTPYLHAAATAPAGMLGSLLAVVYAVVLWRLTPWVEPMPYGRIARIGACLVAAQIGYGAAGPAAADWLVARGLPAESIGLVTSGLAVTAATWWLLDRRITALHHPYAWLWAWILRIPTTACLAALALYPS
jgi:hypothetical protein